MSPRPFAGFYPRRRVGRYGPLGCGLSQCQGQDADDLCYDLWIFNAFGCYATEADARRATTMPPAEWKMLAASLVSMHWRPEDGPIDVAEVFAQAWPGPPPDWPILGFDVVGVMKQPSGLHGGRNCSPLTCNGPWPRWPVNPFGLFDTVETATEAAEAWVIDPPEPGPYVVAEIRGLLR